MTTAKRPQADEAVKAGKRASDGVVVAMLPPAPTFTLTDTGNAERFVRDHGDAVRNVVDPGGSAWHVWNGKHWRFDHGNVEVEALTKITVRNIYAEAAREKDDSKRGALGHHARASEKGERRSAILKAARSERALVVQREALDLDPFLFNVDNGTIDLRTGALRPHKSTDMITCLAPVTYDDDARCPRFEQFLADVLPIADVRDFVQRCLGYALTGVVREHLFPIWVGRGGNGKSVLIETVKAVLGSDYSTTLSSDALMAKRGDPGHPAERMVLRGRRLAVASETDAGKKLAESLIKVLTGGDRITARGMRQDPVEWTPTHKLMLLTNCKPRLAGADEGIKRRLRIVPFDVVIPHDKQDPELGDKLRAEAPGVLRWLVEGALRWKADGLTMPAAIASATREYFAGEDILAPFFDECLDFVGEARTRCGDVFAAYAEWCKRNAQMAVSSRVVSQALADRDVLSSKGAHGVREFRGVGLRIGGAGGASTGSPLMSTHKNSEQGNRATCATYATQEAFDLSADGPPSDGWEVQR